MVPAASFTSPFRNQVCRGQSVFLLRSLISKRNKAKTDNGIFSSPKVKRLCFDQCLKKKQAKH